MNLLWDIRVSLDLFLGGIGIGAFLVGALLYYLDSAKYRRVVQRALMIAPLAVIAGLILLLAELGRPHNVFKAFFAVNPTSFMSVGIFLQTAFVLISLFLAWRVVSKGPEALSGMFVYVGAVLAGLIGFYHGFLLTGISSAPWNSAIPVAFFISSVLAGAAFLFLFNPGELEGFWESRKIPVIINVVLTLELVVVFAWFYHLTLISSSSEHAFTALLGSYGMQFWGLTVLLGMILPLFLFTLVLLKKISLKSAFVPASVAIIAGSFFLKNVVVYFGQTV